MLKNALFAGVALGFAVAASGASAGNVALSSDGATFVSGSSFINLSGYSQSIAEANLLTTTPAQAYSNGDTRYIFGGGENSAQTLEIELGSVESLKSFAATFGATDRTPQGLSVEVSTDGTTFTPVSGSFTDLGGEYLISLSSTVTAKYVLYDFGGPSSQYGFGGSGISEVFANTAVPEPAAWALMLAGFGGIGAALRRKTATAVA